MGPDMSDPFERDRAVFERWAEAQGFNINRDDSEKYREYHTATTRWAWMTFLHARNMERQDWGRVHHALAKHGKHPGRTDDHLADVIDRVLTAHSDALLDAYAEGRKDEREDFRTLLQQTQCVRDGWHPFTALALQAELLAALDDAGTQQAG